MKGIFLNDNFELSEFIRLNSSPEGEWTVYVLEEGVFLAADSLVHSSFQLTDYSIEGYELLYKGNNFHIKAVKFTESLLDLIQLEPCSEGQPETVYFLKQGGELPAEFIIKSFKLGSDRIFYSKTLLKGEQYCLLKVEKPSMFLCQLCYEEWGIDQFALNNNQLIPLGYKYSLVSFLKLDKVWRIYDINGGYHDVATPQWNDIYSSLQINVDVEIEEQAVENAAPDPVKVAVSIVPGQRDEPAELWVFEEVLADKLEALVTQASEDEIDNFYITSVICGSKKYFLIRSRNFNNTPLEFPGQALSRFSGFSNFMIPLKLTLNPPLRRDTYRSLFNLKASLLTVVFSEGGKWKSLVVEEKSFEPLSNFINYIVEAQVETVKTMRSRVLFDPGIYLEAMPRPDLKMVRYDGVEKSKEPVDPPVEKEVEFNKEEVETVNFVAAQKSKTHRIYDEDEREAELERELVNQGQSFETWKNLMLVKKDLGKNYDALICFYEALWLTGADNEQQFLSNLPQILKPLNDKRPLVVTAHALIPGEDLNNWVSRSIDSLNKNEVELRIKELWLMWRSVLQVNKDSRHWVRLRENLLNSLNEFGLDLEESPAFIRNRIFLERCKLDKDDPDSAKDFKFATQNLEALYDILLDKLPGPVKLCSRAVLASSSVHNLGNLQTARRWLDITCNDESEASCWFNLFADHCFRKSNSDIASKYREDLNRTLITLRKSAASSIRDMDDYLDSRESESTGSFLSAGNLKRLYPVNDEKLGDDVAVMIRKIKEARSLSEVNWISEVTRQTEVLNTIEDESSLARAVDIISSELRSLKVSVDSKSLIDTYLKALLSVQSSTSKFQNNFYRALTLSNCALGSAGVNFWDQSGEFLKDALISLKNCSYPIDFIDCASVLLGTIEQMPLKLRLEPVKELAQRFCDMIRKNENALSFGRIFPHVVRTVFHMSEAAAGREKISLAQFRNYLKSDEFLILHRLGQEEPV